MKRKEKNLQSRQRILEGALKEFSAKSYGEASLNNICNDNGMSKGIIYYYFKDKDELYLLCVKECFDALTSYLFTAGAIDPPRRLRLTPASLKFNSSVAEI